MANTWFRFKKFTVHQDMAAMKVGTDGVLLGAWAKIENCRKILDVGTGTGLISLMAAQRNNIASVCAIDIDEDAAQQAYENFRISPWNERLRAVNTSFQDFVMNNTELFDCVICNPPFFRNAFASNSHSRNIARHNDSLPYADLVQQSYRVTDSGGKLAVIIPFGEEEKFIEIAVREGFFLSRLTHVKPVPEKGVARSLIELSKVKVSVVTRNIMVVEDKGRHGYSDEYIKLTQDFYLSL